MLVNRFAWSCVSKGFCKDWWMDLSPRNFCKDDFYCQGCALPLSYITLTIALIKLFLLLCCALNILQHSWLDLAAVTFAFLSPDLQCVPLASSFACCDTFHGLPLARGLNFLAADGYSSIRLCRNFFLLCVRNGSYFCSIHD